MTAANLLTFALYWLIGLEMFVLAGKAWRNGRKG